MNREKSDSYRREAMQSRLRDAMQRLQNLNAVVPSRPVENVNDLFQQELTTGDRLAIEVASWIGSWFFVIVQSVFFLAWTVLNVVAQVKHWDPYPFMLMGLVLSIQAAYTAPLIMMAQNRESAKDRLMLHEDFETNRRAVEEIQHIVNILEQHGHLLALLHEKRLQGQKGEEENRNGRSVAGVTIPADGEEHYHPAQSDEAENE